MISVILIGIWIYIILFLIYNYAFSKPTNNSPPGPPRIPIFGSYLFLILINYRHIHRATEWLTKLYKSNIISFYYQDIPGMAVHDLATCKEVLNNPDLDGRPGFLLAKLRDPDFDLKGIFFRDGLFWRGQRRFTLRHLRDYGFGRRFDELEIHINDDLQSFIELLKNGPKYEFERKYYKDNAFLCPFIFSGYPANLFLQIFMNERYSRQDMGIVYRAGEAAFQFQRNADMYGRIFSVFESLRKIMPNLSGYTACRNSSMDLYHIIEEIIVNQLETYDSQHERHFLDKYFKEMKDDPDFTVTQLTHTIVDFIFPALSAISTQISFALQRLIMNPSVMIKCQQEIDNIVGRSRLPNLNDRQMLSYTEATLRESLRLDTLVPNGVPHLALRDTKVGGYDLPKGGFVITVLQSAHVEDKEYKNALTFDPERFLDKNGMLNLKLDTSVPFGAGKRLCAGETFARNILFLKLAAILQNFNLKVPMGHVLPDPSLEQQTTGTIKTPPNFWLIFESR